jgi:hypothetical protein
MTLDPMTEVAVQAWGEAASTARRVRAELAVAWREADRWAPDVALDAARPAAPPRSTPLLVDLACARLQRSARDAHG